jgi:hypothetical protein
VLFLYSRKYGVRNYDVFMAIRDGRRRGRRDEEILATVLGLLSPGYYYSIRGDAYLQQNWIRLKAKLEPIIQEAKKRPPRRKRLTKPAAGPVARGAAAAAAAARSEEAQPVVRFESETKVSRGSVSDRLRRLSGKSYDVFRDRFFAVSRPAIRAVLGRAKTGKKAIFAAVSQDSENLVFGFLKDHYADPYMDWESSEERRELEAGGYELPTIDPVIEECYRRIR